MLQRQTLHHGDAEECVGVCKRQAASSGKYSRPFERDAPCIETSAMVRSDEPVHNTCAAQSGRNLHYVPRETRRRQASLGETATTDETWAHRPHPPMKCRANMKTRIAYAEGECKRRRDRRSLGLQRVSMRQHTRCLDRNLQSRSRLLQRLVSATIGRHAVFASSPPGVYVLQGRAQIGGVHAHDTPPPATPLASMHTG
jgi:hypothetical protein